MNDNLEISHEQINTIFNYYMNEMAFGSNENINTTIDSIKNILFNSFNEFEYEKTVKLYVYSVYIIY